MATATVTIDTWLDAMVDAADELAATLGVDGSEVVARSHDVPRDLAGAYVALVSDEASLQLAVLATVEGCAALARTLLCMEPDEAISDEDVADAIGEVANIVGGGVKTRLVERDPGLKLGLPVFIHGRVQPSEHNGVGVAEVVVGGVHLHLLALCQA